MNALTIYQPWASLKASNEKEYETRSWQTKYRGPLLIHAAKGSKIYYHTLANLDQTFNQALTGGKKWDLGIWDKLPLGKVMAVGTLVDCLEIGVEYMTKWGTEMEYPLPTGNELAFGDYTPGRFAWTFENVHQLKEPIPAKGMQRLWNFDETPHLVAIDPWSIGETKIWTPKGVISGKRVDPARDEDAVQGLEVA